MRVLFSVLNTAYLKNFEAAVSALAERGHEVAIITHGPSGWAGSDALADRLAASSPRIILEDVSAVTDGRARFAERARDCANYLQFLDPKYNATYRARAEKHVPAVFRRTAERVGAGSGARLGVARAVVPAAERLIPPSPRIEAVMERLRPDVALFTPYVGLTTPQPSFLRAARAFGARTVVCVGSWDHLTSKALMRPRPDGVTAWNETQRHEAIALHGIDPGAVAVTGAQCFDHWFGWPPEPREQFCARAGLDPQRPYLLYTCFSPFKGAADEARFVARWLRLLREADDPALREAGVLVRPHPKRLKQWADVDLGAGAALWPRANGLVGDDEARAGLFNSIFHSAGVVGINTSAMIEAGIVGRRVHTLLLPEYWDSQEGTFHFRYLLETAGGLLQKARSFGEHHAQLAESVRAGGRADNDAFVRAFIRPQGLETPSVPRFVAAIEHGP